MPTISQLPAAQTVTASDAVPISQDGAAHSVSLGMLLSSTQPAIIVNSGQLLGRVSLGPGGPEGISVGSGLALNAATLQAAPLDYSPLPIASGLTPASSVVVTDNGTNPRLLAISQLRQLFSAGKNVSIDAAGVIAATTTGNAAAFSIAALPIVTAVAAPDLIAVSQAGTDHAITYASLINGQTIDSAQPAGVVADGDSFWVAQGSNTMVSQNFAAIWPWITIKLPSFKSPVVEISANTTLDGTVHNGRVLVCSQPITLTPLSANMGNGFQCEIINLSTGSVTIAGSVVVSSGTTTLSPGQAASLRCLTWSGGTTLFAFVGNNISTATVPGQVTGLTSPTQTTSSLSISWTLPVSGAMATGYRVEYRIGGGTNWTLVNATIIAPPYMLTGLTAATSYDIRVSATNTAGTGVTSTTMTITTAALLAIPGQPTSLAGSAMTTSGLQLSWQAPTTGGAPASYTLQYRGSGSSTWTGTIAGTTGTTLTVSGLSASTVYDFSVFAVNASGSGPVSSILSATTATPAGAVSSIVWNVAPFGSYTHGTGAIGINVHVTPATAAVRLGFSTSATVAPTNWTAASLVNSDLWGAYVATPSSAGTWYAWASGTDGSAPTPYATAFTVT